MEQYERDVIYARENKLDQRFANSIIEHARILTKEIILDANKKVSILSDSFILNWKKILAIFCKKIVLIVSDKQKENSLIQKLQKEFPNQFKVKFIAEDKFPTDNDTQERVNYIVNAFRYEYRASFIE